MMRRRIFVIDDDADMREALEAFLSQDFDVRCFDSAKPFLAALDDSAPPDCILLDLRMPGQDGFAVQAALKKVAYSAPVIFMSGEADKRDVIAAWREGAADFVLKPFSAAELRFCIDAIFDRSPSPAPEESNDYQLPITRREAQVLLLLAQGNRQDQIASRLDISLRTVKMYRSFLKDKLNLNSLIELARFYDKHKHVIENRARTPNRI